MKIRTALILALVCGACTAFTLRLYFKRQAVSETLAAPTEAEPISCTANLTPAMFLESDPINREEFRGLKVKERQCRRLPVGWEEDGRDGYTMACAVANLLYTPQLGQQQSGYDLLIQVADYLNLHGDAGYELRESVFCGTVMGPISANVLYNAFVRKVSTSSTSDTSNETKEFWQQQQKEYRSMRFKAQRVVEILGLVEALPFIERALCEDNDQVELVQLMHLWLQFRYPEMQKNFTVDRDVKEDDRQSAERKKKRLEAVHELFVELRSKMCGKDSAPALKRALKHYERKLGKCGSFFCKERDDAEGQFFNEPFNRCPPDETLRDMERDSCPLRLL